ncbi:MAG: hypothetical protein QNJ72_31380 [Pleurocapsa sp. MO_226.B13]|nr:hypothetical protein [Pleurocapsa sp. MO_226.B13]
MDLVYFSEPAIGLQPKYSEHPEGGLVGNTLLFYEGKHKDNAGRYHQVPAERVNLLAINTNNDFHQGREIPLMVEHSKTLIGANGAINKLGKMASPVYCRPIEESDLPNPKMKDDLVGKLGAFAQVHVVNRLDEVKNKTIRALSAGIDPVKNKFVEISAVAFPALSGASLLFSAGAYGSPVHHGITDYNEAKEKLEAWEKHYQELLKKFEIFAGTLRAIADLEEKEPLGFNSNQLKRKALEQLTEDLVEHLKISFEETEATSDIYNPNPYEPNLYQGASQQSLSSDNKFSQTETDNIVDFNEPTMKRKKRARRGASA